MSAATERNTAMVAAPAPKDITIDPADKATPAKSDDDRARTDAESAAEVEKHPSKGKFVLYLGPSNVARAVENDEFKTRPPLPGEGTIAEVTAAQWAEVGLKSGRTATHTWELSNDWRLPATDLTQEQVDYLLTARTPGRPPRFALVDAEGNRVDS